VKPLCPKCSRPGVLLFTSVACDFCDPPRGVIRAPEVAKPHGPCKGFSKLSAEDRARYLARGHAHLRAEPHPLSTYVRHNDGIVVVELVGATVQLWSADNIRFFQVRDAVAVDEFGLGMEVYAKHAYSQGAAYMRWDFATGRIVERKP
jgi:hypothetical protein